MNGPTLSFAEDDPDERAAAAPAGPPGFELLAEIGCGGMGVVWRARDAALDREVAVKLLGDKYAPDSQTARRFLDEARITGQLQHPGIPPVYEVGSLADARPFLAMKLIKGDTLDALLKAAAPLDPLGVFEAVAQAVGYAHAHGVIHRDLKPQNVMVGAFGEVQVMDWGLAKVLADRPAVARPADDPGATAGAATAIRSTRDGDGTFTAYGSVLGTPAYMAPEQAAGETDRTDARSDVFGLGAILCVLLTGRPPFEGKDAESVRLDAVRGRTGAAFARLDACGADPGAVALCKRCLATEPADRPASGDVVAADVAALRRAADDRARLAERDRHAAEVRAAEQAKRRRALVGAAGAVVSVLLLGLVGTAAGLWRADAARRDAERAEQDEADQRRAAQTARDAAEAAGRLAAGRRAEAEAARDKARASAVRMYRDRGFLAYEQGNAADGLLWHAHALANLPADARAERDELLRHAAPWVARTAPLQWAARLPPIRCVAITADGGRVVVGTQQGFRSFEVETGKPLGGMVKTPDPPIRIAFSPDGRRLVTTHRQSGVRLWDGDSGAPDGRLVPLPKLGGDCPPVFFPDGESFLVEAGRSLHRLSAADGAAVGEPWAIPGTGGAAWSLAFSPDGARLAVGFSDRVVLLDAATGRVAEQSFPGDGWDVHGLAFGPDGKTLASATAMGQVTFWDLKVKPQKVSETVLGGDVWLAARLPGGDFVFVASDGVVHRFDPRRGQWAREVSQRASLVAAAIEPASRRLVVAGSDHIVRLYHLPAGTDGEGVWTAPADAHAVGGDRVALLHAGEVRVADAATGRTAASLAGPADPANVTLSPDGRTALIVGRSAARFYDAATGRPASAPIALAADAGENALVAPDGRRAVVWGTRWKTVLTLLDAAGTARTLSPLDPPNRSGSIQRAVFGAGGGVVFSAASDTRITRWDTATAAATLMPRPSNILYALAAGGDLVAVGSSFPAVELFRQSDGEPIARLPYPGQASALAFDGPGGRLLVGGGDRRVRLFDVVARRPVGAPWVGHGSRVYGVAFGPGGRSVLSWDATSVRLWDAETGRPFGPPVAPGPVRSAAFNAGGDRLLVAADGRVHSIPIPPPLPDDVGRLREWIAVHFGVEVTANDEAVELTADDWHRRYERWRSR